MRTTNRRCIPIASAIILLHSAPLWAQSIPSSLEEIVVTAQKRAENLQEVPVSVSVVTGHELENAGILGFEEVSRQIPNFVVREVGADSFIFVRGIGSGDNAGFEQSVGMFVDGVHAGRSHQFRAPFLDVQSIEVLRGPQGTLFGKNTIAGAINVHTAKPTDEVEARINATAEQFDGGTMAYNIDTALSGPLTDTFSSRLAVRYRDSEGYFENKTLNEDAPKSDLTVIRLSGLWLATDTIEVLGRYEMADGSMTGLPQYLDQIRPGATLADSLGGFPAEEVFLEAEPHFRVEPWEYYRQYDEVEDDSKNASLNVTFQLGEFELTSLTAYSEFEVFRDRDVDYSPLDIIRQREVQNYDVVSQEFKLLSPLGDTLDYVLGFFYQNSTLTQDKMTFIDVADLGVPLDSARHIGYELESETYALYGQATWHLNDKFDVVAGLRYSDENKQSKQNLALIDTLTMEQTPTSIATGKLLFGSGSVPHDITGSRSTDDLSPSFKFQYFPNDDGMIYASVSRGQKSGSFNAELTDPDTENFEFDDEIIVGYEIGGKHTFLERKLTSNWAIFYMELDDEQESTFNGAGFVVDNVAKSEYYGIELEIDWLISESLRSRMSIANLQADYKSFPNASCRQSEVAAQLPNCIAGDGIVDTIDRSGESKGSPEWSFNWLLNHSWQLANSREIQSQVGVEFRDREISSSRDIEEPSQIVWNARASYGPSNSSWQVALIGKNLTNEEIKTGGSSVPGSTGLFQTFVLPPRSLAVQFKLVY